MEEAHRESRGLGIALTLIPGVEGLYRGRTVSGILLILMTLLAISPFLGTRIAPAVYLPVASLPYYLPGSVLVLLCLYFLAVLTYTGTRRGRSREAGWR